MKISKKIQLSSHLFFSKILCLSGALLFLKLLFEEGKKNVESDLKTELEYKIIFVVLIGLLTYLLTRPKVYYDDANLYIRKINRKEIIIPLKNVTSIFINPLSVTKGTANVTVEFKDKHSENDSIKFTAGYYSASMNEFKILLRKENPNIEML